MNSLDNLVNIIWYPRENTTGVEGNEAFVLGLFCELDFDEDNDRRHIVDAVHHYWDAFHEGSIEAGVNLMRILMRTQSRIHESGKESGKTTLQNKMEIISERLTAVGHPIMPYYEVLSAITINQDKAAEWDKMFELAANGNRYATTLCGLLPLIEEHSQED